MLTDQSAIDYVRAYFARSGEMFDLTSSGPTQEVGCDAIDVVGRLYGLDDNGLPGIVSRIVFTVWVETRADGSNYLYGEW